MSEKRKRGISNKPDAGGKSKKRQKRGFVVGPANLPDGTYKRKNQKIKSSLIERAQIKKNYAKLKRQGKIPDEPQYPKPALSDTEEEAQEPSTAPHPDRQDLIEKAANSTDPDPDDRSTAKPERRKRKPKSTPFKWEYEQAQQRKAEADERRKAREEADKQRLSKLEERERFRRAMAKARTGGPNGQRKLGRESGVLLEKVKKMVGSGG